MFFFIDLFLLIVIALLFVYYTAISTSALKGSLHLKAVFYMFLDSVSILLFLFGLYELFFNILIKGGYVCLSCYFFPLLGFLNTVMLDELVLSFVSPFSILITDLLLYPDWLFSEMNLMLKFITCLILFIGILFLYFIKIYFARLHSGYYFSLELPFFIVIIILSLRFLLYTQDIFLLLILIEIISFSSIILISGQHSRYGDLSSWTIEAALKYFLMGGFSLILFSMAGIFLTYLSGSSTLINLLILDLFYDYLVFAYYEIFYIIYGLFFSAFFIKLGVAPFQYWVADVYDGSDFLITVLLMVIISPVFLLKLIFLTKLLISDFYLSVEFFRVFFLVCGFLSILFGTLGAFSQKRLKRFLAFASMVHSGFVLVFLSTQLILGFGGAFFYVFIYWFMMILLFSIFFIFKYLYPFHHFTFLTDLKIILQGGLFFIVALVSVLLSFAGIPPFMGFFSKYFLFVILLIEEQYFFVFFLIPVFLINSYLYMRLISLFLFEIREIEEISFDYFKITTVNESETYYHIVETYDDIDLFFIPPNLIFLFHLIFFLLLNLILVIFYLDWLLEQLFYFFFFFLAFL
jgi:NADH:ubiquinone oxidoreductase subunit 2 (subunit N)